MQNYSSRAGSQFYYLDIRSFEDKMTDLHAEYTQNPDMKVVYHKMKAKDIKVVVVQEKESNIERATLEEVSDEILTE